MGEILSRDVTLLTCLQKIIVKVNIMGEILSCDVTLLTCLQKIIVKVNIQDEIILYYIQPIYNSACEKIYWIEAKRTCQKWRLGSKYQ